MRIEKERTEFSDISNISTIGDGIIGEKAQQLIDKTPVLQRLGFRTPPRTVFASRFFNAFFQENNLGTNLLDVEITEVTENKILTGSFSQEQVEVIREISQSYGDAPLVVRSSAKGDARGTGIYKTIFTENKTDDVLKGVKEVLASYFSPDAVAFRKDAATGEGFGIIIEPIIGEDFGSFIAPVLSGFGYTSTSRGEGYISVVPGLGCAVESRLSERITKDAIEDYNGSLSDYIFEERDMIFRGFRQGRKSALFRNDGCGLHEYYSAKAFFYKNRYNDAGITNVGLNLNGEQENALYNLNLLPLFSKMDQMEIAFGGPQYFEWAMTFESEKPIFWIIQIADISKKNDQIEFGDFGKVMFMGHTVTGTGVKDDITKIALCWNPEDVAHVNRFNKKNKNYVLVFSSRMTSGGGSPTHLQYNDFSNASVFFEIQDATHLGNPIAHLGGQLDMTNKFFSVLDYNGQVPPDWATFDADKSEEDGLQVYNGKIKVLASERQNRMVLYVEEKDQFDNRLF